MERSIRSVANLTRADGHEFLDIATRARLHTTVTEYQLDRAQDALDDLRAGRFEGAAVILVES
jgi:propanol-preferring alcohol dehydrogenase